MCVISPLITVGCYSTYPTCVYARARACGRARARSNIVRRYRKRALLHAAMHLEWKTHKIYHDGCVFLETHKENRKGVFAIDAIARARVSTN